MIFPPNFNIKTKLQYLNSRGEEVWLEHSSMGWRGSGVKDVKGKEIFEGDRVIFGDPNISGSVAFISGTLGISYQSGDKLLFCPLKDIVGVTRLEVVGHIADNTLATDDKL